MNWTTWVLIKRTKAQGNVVFLIHYYIMTLKIKEYNMVEQNVYSVKYFKSTVLDFGVVENYKMCDKVF